MRIRSALLKLSAACPGHSALGDYCIVNALNQDKQ